MPQQALQRLQRGIHHVVIRVAQVAAGTEKIQAEQAGPQAPLHLHTFNTFRG